MHFIIPCLTWAGLEMVALFSTDQDPEPEVIGEKQTLMDTAIGGRENTLWNEYIARGTYDLATDTQTQIAHQTIYHDAARPSHLVLPLSPRPGAE